jgi:hypothetical protein
LELIHGDVGQANEKDIFGNRYWLSLTDDYSWAKWKILLKSKDETSPMLQQWITWAEQQCGKPVKGF